MLSIVIPALNEKECLPRLLRDLKNQTYRDYEVIVADAGSVDGTQEIAERHGCRITKGGLPGKGRNEGAKKAKGDILLFLDADTRLPSSSFLKDALKEFRARHLDGATCLMSPLSTSSTFPKEVVRSWFVFVNYLLLASEKIAPFGVGSMIFAKKRMHTTIGGFDEKVKFSEDVLYIRQVHKRGKFGILRKVRILWSLRRFEKEQWIKPLFLYILCSFVVHIDKRQLHIFEKGIFEYKFNHYAKLDELAKNRKVWPKKKVKEIQERFQKLLASVK
jgi:glycosyltransferase involved in cell wall biosynthesis